jgi:hypothetical protein
MIKVLVVVSAAAALLAGCAQTPPAAPTISAAAGPVPAGVPIWKQGLTPAMASSTLAPIAGKLTATPPNEIPIDKLKLPPGFKVELWAHGLPGGRAMARSASGKIYVGTRGIGRVYEITDDGGHRPRAGRQADPARRDVPQGFPVRDRDRQGAAL